MDASCLLIGGNPNSSIYASNRNPIPESKIMKASSLYRFTVYTCVLYEVLPFSVSKLMVLRKLIAYPGNWWKSMMHFDLQSATLRRCEVSLVNIHSLLVFRIFSLHPYISPIIMIILHQSVCLG